MKKISTNKIKALQRINKKIELLSIWAESGVPRRADSDGYEYFPKSIRQFNFWDLSSNSSLLQEAYPEIKRSANDTLNSYADLRLQVEGLLLLLKNRGEVKKGKSEKILDLKERLKSISEYASLLEQQLVALRIKITYLESRSEFDLRSRNNVIEELQGVRKQLGLENEDLKLKVSQLTASLMKISPLRSLGEE